jgi:hypothetical protein
MFDAEDPNSQLALTRVLQSLANINTRRIVELLAQGPRSTAELLQFMDSSRERLRDAMQILQEVRLVSEGKSDEGKIYLFDAGGLDLARSWLDRVGAIVDGEGQR